MRISFQFVLISVFLISGRNFKLHANYTEIAGDLPKVVTADKSPYLVVTDIYIQPGKIVRVEAGTVFLFKNFTGVHVLGQLIINGTKHNPVLFTSENDRNANSESSMNPTPYDWNGIYIHKDGVGTDLQNVKISYSVKGIISETRFIRISECIFFENGRSDLMIEGEKKSVMNSVPFSYSVSIKDAMIDGVPIKILHDPMAAKRNRLRYIGLAAFAAGALSGTFAALDLIDSKRNCEKLQDVSDTLNLMRTDEKQVWTKARSDLKRSTAWVVSSFLFSAAGAVSFSWSFTF